jgi:hypothetical protein
LTQQMSKNGKVVIEARNLIKILAEKSVYLPWLIYKLIITIEAPYFSTKQTII